MSVRFGIAALACVLAGLFAWATVKVGDGAWLRFNPNVGAVRPRDYVLLLNPFRERVPEELADREMDTCTIVYWVRRGGGYAGGEDYEDEATFGFRRNGGGWQIVSFQAIC